MKLCYIFMMAVLFFAIPSLKSSPWTAWTEDPSDPIYNPYPTEALAEDYFPCVIYNKDKFNGDGDSYYYKMWHQGDCGDMRSRMPKRCFQPGPDPRASIAISYSNDGVNWTFGGVTTLTSDAFHPFVIYDKNGFGGTPYKYRIWYWNGIVGITSDVIKYSYSTDGVNWLPPQSCSQDPSSPIVTGISGTYFYHLYGPGFVIYNPSATSIPGQPYTFPYVLFYDIASESPYPPLILSIEAIGLAYSSDGITWTRFWSTPVLIPPGGNGWGATYAYRPTVCFIDGMYHMYYCGSNDAVDPLTTVPYAHGIGHATSADGISWIPDPDNPVFIFSDGVPWRNSRTYTPAVIFDTFSRDDCQPFFGQMWFVGGTGVIAGVDDAIGYATLQPEAPSNVIGSIISNTFLNKTECILRLTWNPSNSSDVAFYRIYQCCTVVAEIPASKPLVYTACICPNSCLDFAVAAVTANGMESSYVAMRTA